MRGPIAIKSVDRYVCDTCNRTVKRAISGDYVNFGLVMDKLVDHVYSKHRDDLSTHLSHKTLESYTGYLDGHGKTIITLEEP